jgi:hypothetical protein
MQRLASTRITMKRHQGIAFVLVGASAGLLGCGAGSASRPPAQALTSAPPADEPVGTTRTTAAYPDPERTAGTPWAIADSPRPEPSASSFEAWPSLYPDAARGLKTWIREHPRGASRLAQWDDAHPERVRALILWSVTHLYEDVRLFTTQRAGWATFDGDDPQVKRDLREFVMWCRRSAPAASELAVHPRRIARLVEGH